MRAMGILHRHRHSYRIHIRYKIDMTFHDFLTRESGLTKFFRGAVWHKSAAAARGYAVAPLKRCIPNTMLITANVTTLSARARHGNLVG